MHNWVWHVPPPHLGCFGDLLWGGRHLLLRLPRPLAPAPLTLAPATAALTRIGHLQRAPCYLRYTHTQVYE